MAITSPGIGSNLDVNSIISNLMAVEQQPLVNLARKEASFQSKISALGSLKSALAQLQSAAKGLVPGTDTSAKDKFTSYSAAVAKPEIATATASKTAVPGSYKLEVTALADSQKIITNGGQGWSADTTFAKGVLTIEKGNFGTSAFEAPVEIDLSDKQYTLAEVRDKINASKSGVSATLLNANGETRLVLAGPGVGADNAFKLSVTPAEPGGGSLQALDALAFDNTTANFEKTQTAGDASAKIDDVSVTAKGNTLTNVIDGVTLNLLKTNVGDPTRITVSRDQSGPITGSLNAFVKGFNDFNTAISSLTAYNAETKAAGALQGDASARSAQGMVRMAINNVPSELQGARFQRLSDIGVQVQKDGTLKVDSSKLSKAIETDFEAVANLAAAYGKAFDGAVEGLTSSQGIVSAREEGIKASVKSLDKDRQSLGRRLESIEARYRAQFTALDQLIGSMSQTSSYLTQQLANLPKISG